LQFVSYDLIYVSEPVSYVNVDEEIRSI
jgi:hypothetical protein